MIGQLRHTISFVVSCDDAMCENRIPVRQGGVLDIVGVAEQVDASGVIVEGKRSAVDLRRNPSDGKCCANFTVTDGCRHLQGVRQDRDGE